MSKRANREMWVERIRSWKAIGKSATEFAVGEEYHPKMLTWWANRLERETPTRIKMARVQVNRLSPKNTIAVEVRGARVVLENGFDEKLFRAVVDALARR
jgi:hypothetical protein